MTARRYRRPVRADGVLLRDATADDGRALTEALYSAVNWQGTVRLTRDDIAADPRLSHYVAGWPRPGDLGVVAVSGGEPVGAAWCRTFPPGDPGYGFVAEDVPEVSMGVVPARRGQGTGTALLDGLVTRARARGTRALSLSVEDGNRARVLYERAGFVVVGRSGDSDVMLLDL